METWVREHWSDVNVTKATSKSGRSYLLCWVNPTVTEYLPDFYMALEECEGGHIVMKVLTASGAIVRESKGDVATLQDFLRDFRVLRMCEGIKEPGDILQFDIQTFSRIYLVERRGAGGDVALRSQACMYAVTDNNKSSCEKCRALDSTALKSEDDFDLKPSTDENYDPCDDLKDELIEIDQQPATLSSSNRKKKRRVLPDKKIRYIGSTPSPFKRLCEICCVTYEQEDQYVDDQRKHELSDQANESVKCPSCYVSVLKTRLNSHFAQDHPELKAGVCLECNKTFSPRDKVSVHYHRCHREVTSKLCPICGTNTSSLKAHMSKAHRSDKKPRKLLCVQCGGEFASKVILNRHIQFVHESKKQHSCKFCGQGFKTESHLRMHYWSLHLKAKPYKCRHCAYVAKQPNRIYEHCRDVHKLKGDRSDVTEVESELERIREFETQHGIYRKKVVKQTAAVTNKRTSCCVCDKPFEPGSLEAHEIEHLQLKPFKCTVCNQSFASRELLTDHSATFHVDLKTEQVAQTSQMEVYEKVRSIPSSVLRTYDQFKVPGCNQCDRCNSNFESLAHFYLHADEEHSNKMETNSTGKKLVCKKCDLETFSAKVLLAHVQEVHQMDMIAYEKYEPPPIVQLEPKVTRPRQFRCKHCLTYTAVKKFTVHRHIRKVHKLEDSTDSDLMSINDILPPAAAAAAAAVAIAAVGTGKLEQILNSKTEITYPKL